VSVAVTGAFGSGAGVAADPSDGQFDVVVIEAGSRARLALHAYGVRAGKVEEQPTSTRPGAAPSRFQRTARPGSTSTASG
jgi:diacylglycerol kinase family enzyme